MSLVNKEEGEEFQACIDTCDANLSKLHGLAISKDNWEKLQESFGPVIDSIVLLLGGEKKATTSKCLSLWGHILEENADAIASSAHEFLMAAFWMVEQQQDLEKASCEINC